MQDAYSSSLLSFDPVNDVYSFHPLIHDCLRSITTASNGQKCWSDGALP